ncbi:hypothetical protein [Nibribacter koreensis]|uniref:Uncharacterized protein n=1 Tax=Nibribacter koreensis TaxID=1084519 RepID=A0ABP8FGU7_9BACT
MNKYNLMLPACKLYILSTTSASVGDSGEPFGSIYNLERACPFCGTAAQLVGPIRSIGLSKAKKDFFDTLGGDLMLSEKLKQALEDAGLMSNCLYPVHDTKGNVLPLYHINPTLTLPKAHKDSTGLKKADQCKNCKRDGHFNEAIIGSLENDIPTYVAPLQLNYDNVDADFLNSSDAFNTWEHFGISRLKKEGNYVVHYARPLIIVNERVKAVFEKLKIKHTEFEEVTLRLPADSFFN